MKMKSHLRIQTVVVVILAALLVISCSRSQRQRLAIAYVVDMTASVDDESILQAFAAIRPLLNNKTLRRGDSITIIPVTGDSLTESQGKVIRIHLPENREVYDSDLVKLANQLEENVRTLQMEASRSPYQHSDILGAADIAAEELSSETGNIRKLIVILSDFVQDDSRFNFNTSPDLATQSAALVLARKLSVKHHDEFAATTLYLGMLRSKDLRRMSGTRREAVQAFWREYFTSSGAVHLSIAIDGPGKIPTLAQLN